MIGDGMSIAQVAADGSDGQTAAGTLWFESRPYRMGEGASHGSAGCDLAAARYTSDICRA